MLIPKLAAGVKVLAGSEEIRQQMKLLDRK
jgi:hypothetical protein